MSRAKKIKIMIPIDMEDLKEIGITKSSDLKAHLEEGALVIESEIPKQKDSFENADDEMDDGFEYTIMTL